jgi:hypothetical protein
MGGKTCCTSKDACVVIPEFGWAGGGYVLYPQKLGGPRRKVYGMYILGRGQGSKGGVRAAAD